MSQGKLKPLHLQRRAYVYVRQSSTAQVLEHAESRRRQYALVERALTLGWPRHAIEVVDEDQGKSGASAEGRTGFERLVHAVAHGQAGAIFALEVSRLARSSTDWQRLLSLCAVAEVIVVDESAVYAPADADDKLLLDLKGTMSEAELHWLGLRMVGARRAKALRGELRITAPTGYVWTEGGLVMDADEAVQRALRLVFQRFEVEPSALAVVRWARKRGLRLPVRRADGELQWKPLSATRVHNLLHNPTYAGCYAFGRRPERKALVHGEVRRVRASNLPPEEWTVCRRDAHPAYITWQQYQDNLEKLRRNHARMRLARPGAPREGAALLPGLLLCGRCGRRMRVRYRRSQQRAFIYVCLGEQSHGGSMCWTVYGADVDAAVERLFLSAVVPDEVSLSLAVEREVGTQSEALARQWEARLEKARYEARRAERRYKAVEPENRVVARTLEAQWEERLQQLAEVEQHYAQAREQRHVELTQEERARIRALAKDLPAVWRAPTTLAADRKAMLRLVVEAVCLTPVDVPRRTTRVDVQWQSGAVSRLTVQHPSQAERIGTPPAVVARVRTLAAQGLTDLAAAEQLNADGLLTAKHRPWTAAAVRRVRKRHRIALVPSASMQRVALPHRHPDGRYSLAGAAARFGVTTARMRWWVERGLVPASREDFHQHRGVYWLSIDEDTAARLEAMAASRRATLTGPSARHPDGRRAL